MMEYYSSNEFSKASIPIIYLSHNVNKLICYDPSCNFALLKTGEIICSGS